MVRPFAGKPTEKRTRSWPSVGRMVTAERSRISAAAYRDQTAFSGAFGLKGVFFNFLIKQPVQVVLQGDAAVLFLIISGRKGRLRAVNLDAEPGGRSKGVSLHMVDAKNEVPEEIRPSQILVGRVAFMVHCAQHAP